MKWSTVNKAVIHFEFVVDDYDKCKKLRERFENTSTSVLPIADGLNENVWQLDLMVMENYGLDDSIWISNNNKLFVNTVDEDDRSVWIKDLVKLRRQIKERCKSQMSIKFVIVHKPTINRVIKLIEGKTANSDIAILTVFNGETISLSYYENANYRDKPLLKLEDDKYRDLLKILSEFLMECQLIRA